MTASTACSRSSPTKDPRAAHRRRSNRPSYPGCGTHRMVTTILDVGAVSFDPNQQAGGVGDDVAFAAPAFAGAGF